MEDIAKKYEEMTPEELMVELNAVGEKASELSLKMIEAIEKSGEETDEEGNPVLDERQLMNMAAQTTQTIQNVAAVRKQELIAMHLGVSREAFLALLSK